MPPMHPVKSPSPLMTTLLVWLTFLGVRFGTDKLYALVGIDTNTPWTIWGYTAHVLTWYVLLPLLVLIGLHGFAQGWRQVGWRANLGQGIRIALLMTLPMLIGFAVLFKPVDLTQRQIWVNLYVGALWAGLSEETFYRAFCLGQLYRFGRWPFLLAALAQAVAFGASHLYQAHELGEALGIFAITALGALWFGWLWLAWRNLWVPIFVHVLMNAWWMVFTVAPTALGGWASNGLRALTIGLSVWLTLRELHQQGRSHLVWRETQ